MASPRHPDAALGTVEVPGPGDTVASATLDDGTPIFVVNFDGTLNVVDARSPVPTGSLPLLVAWCDSLAAFDTGALPIDGDRVNRLGFDADGTAFGPFESRGLTRYAIQRDGRELVILSSSVQAGGRIDAAPDCPRGAERVMHRPAEGEVFDPSVAVDAEPLGTIWLEGTLRPIGNQALLCDEGDADSERCPAGAVARGIDPATIAPEGTTGLFIGLVRDGAIVSLAHALVLSEAEAS